MHEQLLTIHYTVRDAAAQQAFYRDVLGMRAVRGGLGYEERQAALVFEESGVDAASPAPDDLYWKIGIVVGNLDHAVHELRCRGVEVSDPKQFRDIGYLCHLRDPEGFTIELLQQGFEGNHCPVVEGHAVGAQATLAHLTLRISDLEHARSVLADEFGMRLLSIQPVRDLGFTLYFYAWIGDPLPRADLAAVENREWLWARPVTLVELQHLERADGVIAPRSGAAGFRKFVVFKDGREVTIPADRMLS